MDDQFSSDVEEKKEADESNHEAASVNRPKRVNADLTVQTESGPHAAGKDIDWLGVSYKIGGKSILTNCFGSVSAGNICAVMGPSGCGKTSLLNVLAGRTGNRCTA
jgi:ATPase subunit of ABC transporter with duplicated ATPase domains